MIQSDQPDQPAVGTLGDRPRRRRRVLFRVLLVVGATLLALLTAECAVRLMGRVDADGNFQFRGRIVGRRHPPVAAVRETLVEYRSSTSSRMIYDATTGWKPRPRIVTHGGNYRYDARGIRTAGNDYDLTPADGSLRIALFGDSFTHGDDVPFEQTWGALLEAELNRRGVRTEVINFGVSAYAMDQAFLRWRSLGQEYSPDVVLFGFQAENVNRNVNMLRAFYAGGTGIPFSKPRYVLQDGRLRLINSPTLPLERIPEVMSNMESWKLAGYEAFYDSARFRSRFWHGSRFLSLVVEALSEPSSVGPVRLSDPFRLDAEPARVSREILREFRRDAARQDAAFVVVHLPKQADLQRLLQVRSCVYQALLDRLSQEHVLVDPQPQLLAACRSESLDRLFQRHYSPAGNRIIAEVVAEFLARRRASQP